jgi:hypothetical protein
LSLAKFIRPRSLDFSGSYCRIRGRAQARRPYEASNYRGFKKLALTCCGVLWNASKSVKVSRDRTVVLTIFWRVSCKQSFAGAHWGIGANQATAMTRLTVKKDRKKHAA